MLRIFGRSHRGRSFHRMARFGWSGPPIRYRDRGHRSDTISGDIEGSRGWNRYNCAGVINWLVVYFRIVARRWNDRDLSRRESESERDELRIVYYSLIFLPFFSLLFFFFIQNTPAIRINCHWFVQTVFFPLTEDWTGEGRIISLHLNAELLKTIGMENAMISRRGAGY